MTCREILAGLKSWFSEYAARFGSGGTTKFTRNIDLKAEHTRRVCAEILDMGGSLGLSDEDLCLAETAALFHDVGRFEQYARYGTFRDSSSEDHAALGVRVLVENDVLEPFDDFKALQMGWVFDVNFPRTFRLIRERGFLEAIRDALPPSKRASKIYSRARSYLEEKCNGL